MTRDQILCHVPFTQMPCAGTIVNASEDVLSALLHDSAVRVPARKQQDLVALVKTVYVIRHPHCVPEIQNLAALVAQDLTLAPDNAEAEVEPGRLHWDITSAGTGTELFTVVRLN